MADGGPGSSATVTQVWRRAVVTPAIRRATPVWLGCGIVGSVIFGPTGMKPHDLTALALNAPITGVVLCATWLLLYLPAARVIVRADGARYLRSLPAPAWSIRALAIAALVGLQWPWVGLWLAGAGGIGALVVAATTMLVVVLALWRGRPPRVGALYWRGPVSALFGIYARALRRRAVDALLRAVGLAVLAGLAGGLFARNNQLDADAAGVMATAVIAVVLAPGWAGAVLPLAETHRDSAWLAASTGVSATARQAALSVAAVAVYAATAAIALAAAACVLPDAWPWLAAVGLASAVGAGLFVSRALARAASPESGAAIAARAVTGVIVASALAVLALGLFGAPGAIGIVAIGVLAVGRTL